MFTALYRSVLSFVHFVMVDAESVIKIALKDRNTLYLSLAVLCEVFGDVECFVQIF